MALGILAAGSILASEVPGVAAWPLALMALGYSGWLAGRDLRRPVQALLIPCGTNVAVLDGVAMTSLEVQWRGPLAFLHWRDPQGLRRRLQFWPDTLPARTRRELRLAMVNQAPTRAAGSMAP